MQEGGGNTHTHTNTHTALPHTHTHTHTSPHSVGAGTGQVYGHRTRSRAVIRQEVVKAVEVSGGARFWWWGWGGFAGSANQQVDSLSAGLEETELSEVVLCKLM